MLEIIFFIILFFMVISYIILSCYYFNQSFISSRYKPYYNYEILDYADEIKKRIGISKYELRGIIKGGKSLTTHQLIAISVIMDCDLNHLICDYSLPKEVIK